MKDLVTTYGKTWHWEHIALPQVDSGANIWQLGKMVQLQLAEVQVKNLRR